MPPNGLEAVYLANRDKLVRFLCARGAGDGAEDLVHDLWLRVSGQPAGPVGNPLAYLFRAADLLMIDRYRSRRQAERREQAWEESRTGDAAAEPDAERQMVARQETARVEQLLRTLGPRKESVFRRARIDGVPQRRIAEELGISISTVESDLRIACHALARLKEDMA
jgi:RNA polymerase sigma-70 factor (ECF subfamily)